MVCKGRTVDDDSIIQERPMVRIGLKGGYETGDAHGESCERVTSAKDPL